MVVLYDIDFGAKVVRCRYQLLSLVLNLLHLRILAFGCYVLIHVLDGLFNLAFFYCGLRHDAGEGLLVFDSAFVVVI